MLMLLLQACGACLIEAIQSFVELADETAMGGVDEASGLPSVDILADDTVEKGVVDVELVEGQSRAAAKVRTVADLTTGRYVSL